MWSYLSYLYIYPAYGSSFCYVLNPHQFTMGKNKTGLALRASEYTTKGIIVNGQNLVCSYCGIMVPNTKTQIEQHLNTKKHKNNVGVKTKFKTLPAMEAESEFSRDVCKVSKSFVRLKILIYLLNKEFKNVNCVFLMYRFLWDATFLFINYAIR